MKFFKFVLVLIPVVFLTACGGNSENEYNDVSYINWAGSVNGTLVVDATDDTFEFELYTGYLHFGNTTYTNAWVDDYGDFYIDYELIGSVYYIESIDNEIITALISNNGYYIDIYGPESDLAWTETQTMPIYALGEISTASNALYDNSIYRRTAQQGDINSAPSTAPPLNKMNAYSENLPGNNKSILKKRPDTQL